MHARRTARDAYFATRADDVYFTERGDVSFADSGAARRFADRVNALDRRTGDAMLRLEYVMTTRSGEAWGYAGRGINRPTKIAATTPIKAARSRFKKERFIIVDPAFHAARLTKMDFLLLLLGPSNDNVAIGLGKLSIRMDRDIVPGRHAALLNLFDDLL